MTGSEASKIVRAVLGKGMTFDEVEQILKVMVPVTVGAGTPVLAEKDKPQGLLVLLAGTVEIVKAGPRGASEPLAVVEAPAVLGEISLITERPHSATVTARTACEFRLLTRSQFDRLLQAESLAAYKLIRTLAEVLARRLSLMDAKFVELAAHPDGAPPVVDELARLKQKLFSDWSL